VVAVVPEAFSTLLLLVESKIEETLGENDTKEYHRNIRVTVRVILERNLINDMFEEEIE